MAALLTSALPYASSAILLVILSLVAWPALLSWSADRKRLLPLAAYLFLIIAGTVLCLATFRLTSGWLYSLFGCLLGLALLGSLRGRSQSRMLILSLSTLVLIVPLLVLAASTAYRESSRTNQAKQVLTTLEKSMATSAATDKEEAKELAALPLVQSLNSSSTGLAALRQEAVSRSLDFVILTDAQGHILLQTNEADTTGETVTDSLPWTSHTLSGETLSGLAWDDQGQLAAMAAEPINANGSQIGMVITGSVIDSLYLNHQDRTGSLLVLENQRVAAYSAISALDTRMSLNDGLAYQASQQPSGVSFVAELSNSHAIATTEVQPTLDPSRSFRIVRLTDE